MHGRLGMLENVSVLYCRNHFRHSQSQKLTITQAPMANTNYSSVTVSIGAGQIAPLVWAMTELPSGYFDLELPRHESVTGYKSLSRSGGELSSATIPHLGGGGLLSRTEEANADLEAGACGEVGTQVFSAALPAVVQIAEFASRDGLRCSYTEYRCTVATGFRF